MYKDNTMSGKEGKQVMDMLFGKQGEKLNDILPDNVEVIDYGNHRYSIVDKKDKDNE